MSTAKPPALRPAHAPGDTVVSFNVWQLARRRKGAIVLCGLLGLAVAFAYCWWRGREYESSARILVMKKRLETTPISGPTPSQSSFDDYLASHQVVVTSPRIVQQAIAMGNLAELDCFEGKEDLTKAVIESLSTNRVFKLQGGTPPSNIMNLSFRAGDPEDAQKVLAAILSSYEKFLKDTTRDGHVEALELISKARDVLHNDIASKGAEYLKFRETLPLGAGNKDGKTIQQDRLAAFESKRSAVRMRRAELEASLLAIAKAQADGRSASEVSEIITGLQGDQAAVPPGLLASRDASLSARSGRSSLEEELTNLQLEEGRLLETFGPMHQQVQAIRGRINTVSRLLAPASGVRPALDEPPARQQELVDLRVRLLKREVEASERAEQALAQLYASEEKEARRGAVQDAKEQSLRQDLERSQVLYESIIKRLQEVDAVKDYAGYNTQVLAQPERGIWVWKRSALILAIGAFAGMTLGLGGAVVRHASDHRFRTPKEVQHRLGVPVMSHIPWMRPISGSPASNGAPLHSLISAYHRPDSPEAEAFRAVRTALYFAARADQHSVIQITSPEDGDGKSTLAGNLAVSIAQSGMRVLLVDADFRRPRVHTLFGLGNDKGLSAVLSRNEAPANVIQATNISGLEVLTSGDPPPNPAELLMKPRLGEVFETLRQQYDVVLVDTPPLLGVSDSSVVAARVDGVILTLDISKRNGRPGAERAKTILDELGAHVLGVVVNAAPARRRRAHYAVANYPEDAEY
jgi:succinoglycan biosynthesis transport protein ExoP